MEIYVPLNPDLHPTPPAAAAAAAAAAAFFPPYGQIPFWFGAAAAAGILPGQSGEPSGKRSRLERRDGLKSEDSEGMEVSCA